MNDDTTRLDNIPPLGKSVEEVEQDNQNRFNSSTPGEERGDDRLGGFVAPVANTGTGTNTTGTGVAGPGIPVVPVVPLNTDLQGGQADGPRDEITDNSEA